MGGLRQLCSATHLQSGRFAPAVFSDASALVRTMAYILCRGLWCVHVCMCMRVCACVWVCMCVCVYVYVCLCVYVCMGACLWVYVCMVYVYVCVFVMCLYAVSPFSDGIYGTVTVRSGPKPYNTVKMKLRYGSGMVREYGQPFLGLFAGKKEVLDSNPGLNRTFCFFPPLIFLCVSS